MSNSHAHLVPITREVLRAFYAKNPLDHTPEDQVEAHIANVRSLLALCMKQGSKVEEKFGMETPKRIDDCFWRSRQFCEETAHSCRLIAAAHPDASAKARLLECAEQLDQAELAVREVQQHNTEAAAKQVGQFLPQDFRGRLIEYKRHSGEARYKRQVDDLISSGGTIRDRYELYLRQQWERREALVAMGNLSGMFKVMVKYLGGIPQVLLDFAKEINAKIGPMEEQRVTYGPDLYPVLTLGIRINVLAAAWQENMAQVQPRTNEVLDVLQPAVTFYCHHLTRVVGFLGQLFVRSPFFVSSDEVQAASAVSQGTDAVQGAPPSLSAHSARSASTADLLGCAETVLAAVGVHPHSSKPPSRVPSHTGSSGLTSTLPPVKAAPSTPPLITAASGTRTSVPLNPLSNVASPMATGVAGISPTQSLKNMDRGSVTQSEYFSCLDRVSGILYQQGSLDGTEPWDGTHPRNSAPGEPARSSVGKWMADAAREGAPNRADRSSANAAGLAAATAVIAQAGEGAQGGGPAGLVLGAVKEEDGALSPTPKHAMQASRANGGSASGRSSNAGAIRGQAGRSRWWACGCLGSQQTHQ